MSEIELRVYRFLRETFGEDVPNSMLRAASADLVRDVLPDLLDTARAEGRQAERDDLGIV